MRLELGISVRCTDEKFGDLCDVVIDPQTRRVTHIVVSRKFDPPRLVPIGLVEPAPDDELMLRCTVAEANELEAVTEVAYVRLDEVPVEDPDWDVGIERAVAMPYSPMGDPVGYAYAYDDQISVAYDRVPKGEVEIRRRSQVVSSDDHVVGHVDGFVVGADDQITHLVLEHGHLWARRNVSVPVSAIANVANDVVNLSLTKAELAQLP